MRQPWKEDYADDAPYITDETDFGELTQFAVKRTAEPIELSDGTLVYDYCSHVPDYEGLEDIQPELSKDVYVIPFQVTTAWTYIWSILPVPIREHAGFLIYIANRHEYEQYNNFYEDARGDERYRMAELEVWEAYTNA